MLLLCVCDRCVCVFFVFLLCAPGAEKVASGFPENARRPGHPHQGNANQHRRVHSCTYHRSVVQKRRLLLALFGCPRTRRRSSIIDGGVPCWIGILVVGCWDVGIYSRCLPPAVTPSVVSLCISLFMRYGTESTRWLDYSITGT